jgi:hypothetical protein
MRGRAEVLVREIVHGDDRVPERERELRDDEKKERRSERGSRGQFEGREPERRTAEIRRDHDDGRDHAPDEQQERRAVTAAMSGERHAREGADAEHHRPR